MRKLFAMLLGLGLSMGVGALAGPVQGKSAAAGEASIVTVKGTLGTSGPGRNWVIENWVQDGDARLKGQPRRGPFTWTIEQDGKTYYLDLQDNAKLLALASKMKDKKVA